MNQNRALPRPPVPAHTPVSSPVLRPAAAKDISRRPLPTPSPPGSTPVSPPVASMFVHAPENSNNAENNHSLSTKNRSLSISQLVPPAPNLGGDSTSTRSEEEVFDEDFEARLAEQTRLRSELDSRLEQLKMNDDLPELCRKLDNTWNVVKNLVDSVKDKKGNLKRSSRKKKH